MVSLTKILIYLLVAYQSRLSVLHSYSWKLIKPHMLAIIQDVIFPIMSHTEADQAQWDSDPYEYIRLKFGKFLFS